VKRSTRVYRTNAHLPRCYQAREVFAVLTRSPLRTPPKLVAESRPFEPGAKTAESYDRLYRQRLELHRRSLELSWDGLVRPLWPAAGTD
jgi:hypothetical protein